MLDIASLIVSSIRSASPVIIASVGEIHAEKAGVMNLGVEGMMMFGAFASFAGVHATGSISLGILCGIIGGGLLALLHSILVISLGVDHIISGISIGVLGTSLADFFGRPFIGKQIDNLQPLNIEYLTDIPYIGKIVFGHNPLVYLFVVLIFGSWFVFQYLRIGSSIVAVGDNPKAADAAGIQVIRLRYVSVVYGGMLAGLAGAYMTLNYSTTFVSNITSGRGWIAIALVIFASWRPLRATLGGLLFGSIEALQFHLSLMKIKVPYHFMMMMPYLITIIVLVLYGRKMLDKKPTTPKSLGITYRRD
jgi:general nucleoside transport system permease protein